jgi:curved DNA-binding protein CbpA
MIDYFVLLNQPRAPWLDPDSLKDAYHKKTFQSHPDRTSAGDTDGSFAELNKAYQVLQDPKRRLQHLLELENRPPSAHQTAPEDLEELFLQIGALNQATTQLLAKMRAASNPLSKSLLKANVVSAQKDAGELRDEVRRLHDAAISRLRQTNANQLDDISLLHQRFAYLSRWLAQLDEIAFQLSL